MRGLHKEPVGIDIIELPVLFALQREGITVIDGQQLMSEARVIKTKDEIALLNTSASMVDAAYHELYMAMMAPVEDQAASSIPVNVDVWASCFPDLRPALEAIGGSGRYDVYETTTLSRW